jgi:hypothetical protein
MKKEKPIIIKFNFSKYYFEDKELIYYTNKGIYKYEELFPKSEGYENPLKIKKLKLISIERIESFDNIFGDLEKKFLYKLCFVDNKSKVYDAAASIANIYITNIRKIKSLLSDLGYTVKFIAREDEDFYELVTELVITWYN